MMQRAIVVRRFAQASIKPGVTTVRLFSTEDEGSTPARESKFDHVNPEQCPFETNPVRAMDSQRQATENPLLRRQRA
jgi:hypothetical protein